jgi:hypothetical protein
VPTARPAGTTAPPGSNALALRSCALSRMPAHLTPHPTAGPAQPVAVMAVPVSAHPPGVQPGTVLPTEDWLLPAIGLPVGAGS